MTSCCAFSKMCCGISKSKTLCLMVGGNSKIVHFSKRNVSSRTNKEFDVVVVGGGIIGTASARELKLRHPHLRMAVVEKEADLAKHQTGNNSGVIHAGIYYKPGSLKAKLCVEGMHLAYKYLDEKKIPYKKCGKLIVATDDTEIKRLADLIERGKRNKVPDMKVLKGEKEIRKVEPFCNGLEAIWSPHTGIVDWGLVCRHYGKDFEKSGGHIYLNFEVNGFKTSDNPSFPVLITSEQGDALKSKYVLTCGGLQSDKLAKLSGCPREPRIVPFRGEYLLLDSSKTSLVKGNIYPVPDPRFPFLGVHFTPRMNGDVWLGPNAVLALKREGYRWSDISIPDLIDIFTYPGFIKLATKYFSFGVTEAIKSVFPSLSVKELQKFIPLVTRKDISRGPAGVRAQALDIEGNLVDDFYFDLSRGKGANSNRVLHCRNAPSPGATSSLAIAKMMADKMEEEFGLKKQSRLADEKKARAGSFTV